MNGLKGQAEKKPSTHSSAADDDISNRNLGLLLLSYIIKVSNLFPFMNAHCESLLFNACFLMMLHAYPY